MSTSSICIYLVVSNIHDYKDDLLLYNQTAREMILKTTQLTMCSANDVNKYGKVLLKINVQVVIDKY